MPDPVHDMKQEAVFGTDTYLFQEACIWVTHLQHCHLNQIVSLLCHISSAKAPELHIFRDKMGVRIGP